MRKIKLYTDFNKVAEAPHFGYVFPLVEYLYKKNDRLQDFYEVVSRVEEADFLALPLSVEYLLQTQKNLYYHQFLDYYYYSGILDEEENYYWCYYH